MPKAEQVVQKFHKHTSIFVIIIELARTYTNSQKNNAEV
jgi:hypothetical protein